MNGLKDDNGNHLPHLLDYAVDQTLHWANPEVIACCTWLMEVGLCSLASQRSMPWNGEHVSAATYSRDVNLCMRSPGIQLPNTAALTVAGDDISGREAQARLVQTCCRHCAAAGERTGLQETCCCYRLRCLHPMCILCHVSCPRLRLDSLATVVSGPL